MIENIVENFILKVENVFNNGVGLRSVELKNYTGPKLQQLSTFAIENVANEVFGVGNWKIDHSYVHDETGYFESQRLDDHLWYNGKIIMAGESRAWMDKPFSHMKYGVINTWLGQPHTARVTHPNAFFPVLVFAQDVTEKTFNTLNFTYRLGDKIKFYNLSGQKRDSKRDYFYRGFSRECSTQYIMDLYKHMLNIKNNG
jgi:hypothetical protein